MEAFQYLSGGSSVYIECVIRVCLTNDNSLECKQCLTQRKRREVIEDSNNNVEERRIVKSSVFYVVDTEGNIHCNFNFRAFYTRECYALIPRPQIDI